MRSIEMAKDVPRIIRVANGFRKQRDPLWDENERAEELRQAEADAEFAKKTCDEGFPLLRQFTLVGFWSRFEAAVEDVVVGIISNEPSWLRGEPFGKIRIPLAEYEPLE